MTKGKGLLGSTKSPKRFCERLGTPDQGTCVLDLGGFSVGNLGSLGWVFVERLDFIQVLISS